MKKIILILATVLYANQSMARDIKLYEYILVPVVFGTMLVLTSLNRHELEEEKNHYLIDVKLNLKYLMKEKIYYNELEKDFKLNTNIFYFFKDKGRLNRKNIVACIEGIISDFCDENKKINIDSNKKNKAVDFNKDFYIDSVYSFIGSTHVLLRQFTKLDTGYVYYDILIDEKFLYKDYKKRTL